MLMIILTLLSSLALAAVAAWFSVAGLVALFSGNVLASIVMGVTIELGKLVGISWLYRNWRNGPWFKWPMAATVIVALLVTSIGIFGFLSKSHLDHAMPGDVTTNQIAVIDARVAREEEKKTRYLSDINGNKVVLDQLDAQVASLIANNKISDPKKGARVVRESQKEERATLSASIEQANVKIDAVQEVIGKLNEEKLALTLSVQNLEREVGPIKYVAAVFYDDPDASIDKAVRIMIILVMTAFDPLAVFLLMGANFSMMQRSDKPLPPPTPILPPKRDDEDVIDDDDEPCCDDADESPSELEQFLAHTASLRQRAAELENEKVEQYNQLLVQENAEPEVVEEPVTEEPVQVATEVESWLDQAVETVPFIPPTPTPMDLLGYNSVFSNGGVPANQKGHIIQQRIEDLHRRS